MIFGRSTSERLARSHSQSWDEVKRQLWRYRQAITTIPRAVEVVAPDVIALLFPAQFHLHQTDDLRKDAPCNISQHEIVKKELTLVGSRLNRHLLPEVVEWLESGTLQPEAMITQTFDAKEAQSAFDLVDNHPEQTVKVQLVFGAR